MKFFWNFFSFALISILLILLSLQGASYFFLKPILERRAREILQVPVRIGEAGANVFDGSVYMKQVRVKNPESFSEPDMFAARTVAFNFNVLSLLTNEIVIDRILFKDPVITIEINEDGDVNYSRIEKEAVEWMSKMVRKKRKLIQWITHYELEKFSIRRGTVQLVDRRQEERDWHWGSISFSLARLVYPPDPNEALPAAIYLNAKAQGETEGQIFLIGRFHPFVEEKSFDLTGSLKDIVLSEYNHFFSSFPLEFNTGILEAKIKALCHDNQVDIRQHIRMTDLHLSSKKIGVGEEGRAFGIPSEMVASTFNDLWNQDEPFELEFQVVGDLSDPNFDFMSETTNAFSEAVYQPVQKKMNEMLEITRKAADKALSLSQDSAGA
jgi:uncharacterized protein involved in outer membrane biogenesis